MTERIREGDVYRFGDCVEVVVDVDDGEVVTQIEYPNAELLAKSLNAAEAERVVSGPPGDAN